MAIEDKGLSISLRDIQIKSDTNYTAQIYFKDPSQSKFLRLGDTILDKNIASFKVVNAPENPSNGVRITLSGRSIPQESTSGFDATLWLGGLPDALTKVLQGQITSSKLIDYSTFTFEINVTWNSQVTTDDIDWIKVGNILTDSNQYDFIITDIVDSSKTKLKVKPKTFEGALTNTSFVLVIEQPNLDAILKPGDGGNSSSADSRVFISDVISANPERSILVEHDSGKLHNIVRTFRSGVSDVLVEIIWNACLGDNPNHAGILVNNVAPTKIFPLENDRSYFKGLVPLSLDTAKITATNKDGFKHEIIGTLVSEKPTLKAIKILPLSNGQSESKYNELIKIQIETTCVYPFTVDIESDYLELINEEYVPNDRGFSIVTLKNKHADKAVLDVPIKLRVTSKYGYTSEWLSSARKITLNNNRPDIKVLKVLYPEGQTAIKSSGDESEFAYISIESKDGTHFRFRPLNNESLYTEFDDEGFVSLQDVKRSDGIMGARVFVDPSWEENQFNISNVEVIAFNQRNNTEFRTLCAVDIANLNPECILEGAEKGLVSGGNNGTDPVQHTLRLKLNQEALQDPVIELGLDKEPTVTKLDDLTWELVFNVHDNDPKGNVKLKNFSFVNRAKKSVNTPTNTDVIRFEGFVKRDMIMKNWPYRISEDSLEVEIVNSANVKIANSGLGNSIDVVLKSEKLTNDLSCTLVDDKGQVRLQRGSKLYNNDLDSAVCNSNGVLAIEIEEDPN